MIASAGMPLLFWLCAALLIVWQTWRGWRLGLVRQLVSVLALVAAYAVAIFGGRLALPLLRPFGLPDVVLAVLFGSALGFVVFCALSALGALLFKKTSHQSFGLVRLGYGISGAAIGLLFGVFTVWLALLGVRVLGTVAESDLEMAKDPLARRPGRVAQGLAEMKHGIEHGTTGAVVKQIDPIPAEFYEVLHKIGLTASDPSRVHRFLSFPGAREIAAHPRIQALQRDPAIAREIRDRNYLALLKNEQIVRAANDPELHRLLRQFELQKALDHALRN